jgi:hypothetical protein
MMVIPSELLPDLSYLFTEEFWFDTMKVPASSLMTGQEIHDMLVEYCGTEQAVRVLGRRFDFKLLDLTEPALKTVRVEEGRITYRRDSLSVDSKTLIKVLMTYPIPYIPQMLESVRGTIGYAVLSARLRGDI